MAVDTLEAKVNELIGQLGPGKLAAVVHLLEAMTQDEDDEGDELTGDDRRAIAASREYFRNEGQGLSFAQAVAECGVNMDQFLSLKR